MNPEPIPVTFSIPSINTLSLIANGSSGNCGVGVVSLHVNAVPVLLDLTSNIVIPFVLLIVLKVTVSCGNPIGTSLTFTDIILFSNITGSKNPLSIFSPVNEFTTIMFGAEI